MIYNTKSVQNSSFFVYNSRSRYEYAYNRNLPFIACRNKHPATYLVFYGSNGVRKQDMLSLGQVATYYGLPGFTPSISFSKFY